MFSDTERCPCIFARGWRSHEASCAAAGHDCTACRYCMANITYWGQADEVLRSLASQASSSSLLDAQRRYSASRDAGMHGAGKGGRPSIRWREGHSEK